MERTVKEYTGVVKHLEAYLDNRDFNPALVKELVERIRARFGLTSLKFNTLETLIEAIGLPKCKVCTHCFDGSSHF